MRAGSHFSIDWNLEGFVIYFSSALGIRRLIQRFFFFKRIQRGPMLIFYIGLFILKLKGSRLFLTVLFLRFLYIFSSPDCCLGFFCWLTFVLVIGSLVIVLSMFFGSSFCILVFWAIISFHFYQCKFVFPFKRNHKKEERETNAQ